MAYELEKVVLSRTILVLILLSLALFVPAGSLNYWEAWAYIAILIIPMIFVFFYFLKTDRALLERRMRIGEKQADQQPLVVVMIILFIICFLLPGFDHRFGWSHVSTEVIAISLVFVFIGYFIVFLALKENSFASRIIEVDKNQTVISTGPYAIVRHPLYAGVFIMYLATPLALGSYVALLAFIPLLLLFVVRIVNEEKFLLRELPGYREYCQKTRYRLIPFVW